MKPQHWTKEQYLDWIRTRGPAHEWRREDCLAADQLIEREALAALEDHIRQLPPPLAQFVRDCARAHFGTVECDSLLMQLRCYPDWMVVNEAA